VIVHDLDLIGVAVVPDEADSPLIVDPHAVLTLPITRERLEAIAGRRSQIIQGARIVQLEELAVANP
jgi:hypothetical protein